MADNSDGAAKRRGPGRPFPPGVSGNPGGRPKGFGARIRELTNDGEELIDIALKVARGQLTILTPFGPEAQMVPVEPTAKERMDAVKWLGAYGIGAPPKESEKEPDDFTKLSDEELRAAIAAALGQNAPSSGAMQ